MNELRKYDNILSNNGGQLILGLDEVGKGAGFGPLVVVGLILKNNTFSDEINDSKLLNYKKRERLSKLILENVLYCKIEALSAKVINDIGVSQAERKGMERISSGQSIAEIILIDGNINYLKENQAAQTLVKGDQKSYTIACASIVAKEYRDKLVTKMANKYPGYGIEANKGYPTPKHKEAVRLLGLSEQHRVDWGWD
jgi:ribonuclease HII